MTIKTFTIEELKSDYSTRHGFVVQFMKPASVHLASQVSNALIQEGYTTSEVEFVVELPSNIFVFVYPEGISFDAPRFFNRVSMVGQMMGWRINTLLEFLK